MTPLPLRHRRTILAFCVAVWLAALVITHLPASNLPSLGVKDTKLHLMGYAGIASFFWLTLAAYGVGLGRRVLLGLAVLAAYGALDELTQPIFGRSADSLDFLADMLGASAALLAWETLRGARAALTRQG